MPFVWSRTILSYRFLLRRRTTKAQAPNKSHGDVDQELNYSVVFVSANQFDFFSYSKCLKFQVVTRV